MLCLSTDFGAKEQAVCILFAPFGILPIERAPHDTLGILPIIEKAPHDTPLEITNIMVRTDTIFLYYSLRRLFYENL